MTTKRTVLSIGAVLAAMAAPVWGDGAPVHVLKDGQWVAEAEPVEGTVPGELALVRRYVEEGKNSKAVKAVKSFLKKNTDAEDGVREEMMMLAGQAEMNADRYYQAFEWFNRQLGEYPSGRLYPRALDREFKIAEAFLAGKKRVAMGIFRLSAVDEGLEILARIAEQAPGTEMAERAMLRIPRHHDSRGEWKEAVAGYDLFAEAFPRSQQVPEAMLQAARATYNQYEGPSHPDTPLIEAEQRFRTLAARYPRDAAKAGVQEVLERIAHQRGVKMYETGRFYERTGHPESALFYYRELQTTYPNTPLGVRAELECRRLEAAIGKSAASGPVRPWEKPRADQPARDSQPTSESPLAPAGAAGEKAEAER